MKVKGFVIAILTAGVLFLLSGCIFIAVQENGVVTEQKRNIGEFSSVTLDGIGDINIYYSENYKVVVTTDSNLHDSVITTVYGDVLRINQENFNACDTAKLIIDIYMPALRKVNLNGAGNINIFSGENSLLILNLSGVGNIDAKHYEAENVIIDLSGAGDIKLWATDSVTGKLSGVGNILYRGNPSVNVVKTGIGNINKL